MKIYIQDKILNTKNYYQYLKENSYLIKDLNRSELNYKSFEEYVKNKYSLKIRDRVNNTINSLDNVINLLNLIK